MSADAVMHDSSPEPSVGSDPAAELSQSSADSLDGGACGSVDDDDSDSDGDSGSRRGEGDRERFKSEGGAVLAVIDKIWEASKGGGGVDGEVTALEVQEDVALEDMSTTCRCSRPKDGAEVKFYGGMERQRRDAGELGE
ncbi:hypothetical protein HBI70_232330 [Parastagonospora nodorum]|nr:hypothetical protein HBH53_225030 [Parastagonospora nodorum]KAH5245203.1 hypothetical protein HBI70_232330 [Parastagonospora nodorum]KAH5590384.1 hypothetical protein HBI45_214050 [Parastagonospora nodorum]KAH6108570.1 hypothetical protein HBI64_229300 [Parastagonospora nodorum]